MNRRAVRKALTRKHLHFLKSIKNEKMRDILDMEAFITGGAITSLLLNEKVNDYDYYLTNKEACEQVAHYFVAKFIKDNPKVNIVPKVEVDGDRVAIRIQSSGVVTESGDKDYAYFEGQPEGEGDAYVDNVMPEVENSVQGATKQVAHTQGGQKEKYRAVAMSSNAITLSDGVQIVLRFHGSPEEVHKNYDYVHCTNYWTAKDGQLTLNLPAMESTVTKTLYYVGSLYPVCSLFRLRKFIKRGWNIDAGQIFKIAHQVSELDLSDFETLQEQLTGVDAAYFAEVLEILQTDLKNKPDLKIDGTYLMALIDKVFE